MVHDFEAEIFGNEDNNPVPPEMDGKPTKSSVGVGLNKKFNYSYIIVYEPEVQDSFGCDYKQGSSIISLSKQELTEVRDSLNKILEMWVLDAE